MSSSAPLPPGPRYRIPLRMAIVFRRDPLAFLTRAARDHGDIVSFGRATRHYVLISDPDLIHCVLVTDADQFRKGPALRHAKVILGEGLLTSEGPFHSRQRRLAQPAFHAQRVADYAATIVSHAQHATRHWRDGMPLDIHQQMMALTLQIVAEAMFGTDTVDTRRVAHAMNTIVAMFQRAFTPWGPLLDRLPLPSNFRFYKARAMLYRTIQQFIDQRRASKEERNDLLSMFLYASDHESDGGAMTDIQLRDEAITIFLAGHETTANALSFTWYLLSQHPEIRRKLEQHVDHVLAGRPPTAADAPNLTYVRSVLAESMRLYPPVWAIGRETIRPWKAGSYEIPAGTVVLMSQYVVHRDPRWWPDPLQFNPERWEQKTDRPRYAYFPFGGGSRGCIGEPFAWLEAILLLATLSQHWRLDLADDRPLRLHPSITLRPKNGLPMIARQREINPHLQQEPNASGPTIHQS